MKLSDRRFGRGMAFFAAVPLLCHVAFAEVSGEGPEPLVLGRAIDIVLWARETHVVLAPVPARRRPTSKVQSKSKSVKATPSTHLILRDVVAAKGGPSYDVFLILEGPNAFQATSTRVQVGTLQPDNGATTTFVFEVNDAIASLAKLRGFAIRNLRVALVRRSQMSDEGKATVPADPAPPEIGAIELTRS